jgi:hypothetical protein
MKCKEGTALGISVVTTLAQKTHFSPKDPICTTGSHGNIHGAGPVSSISSYFCRTLIIGPYDYDSGSTDSNISRPIPTSGYIEKKNQARVKQGLNYISDCANLTVD